MSAETMGTTVTQSAQSFTGSGADVSGRDDVAAVTAAPTEATLASVLPDTVGRACRAGRSWAIRLACVWDTLERYDGVRRRHDRLPAHHLVCALAGDVRRLADDDVLGRRVTWSEIATRLEAACVDPLGDDPAVAIRRLVATVTALADDMDD